MSALTAQFLAWCAERLAAEGTTTLLVWDNASWHLSQHVRYWLRTHHRRVNQTGQGVRSITCPLPSRRLWLNHIEPHWVDAKCKVAEPDRLLPARELAERVCAYFNCPYEERLCLPERIPWLCTTDRLSAGACGGLVLPARARHAG